MEDTNTNKEPSSNVDVLEAYRGRPVQLTVVYKEHECIGNLDESEIDHDREIASKTLNYPLLNIFTTSESDPAKRKYRFILSSDQGSDILIPFSYQERRLSLRRWCTTKTNGIEDIIVDGKNITPDPRRTATSDNGTMYVVPNDQYTQADADAMKDGPLLEQYGCEYDEDKHIIVGDIGRLVEKALPLWR